MKVLTSKDGLSENYAQIACVDSEDLSKINQNPNLLHDFQFIMSVLDKDGEHAVITRVELRRYHEIFKHINTLLKTFKTVSWFRNGRLYTRRRR